MKFPTAAEIFGCFLTREKSYESRLHRADARGDTKAVRSILKHAECNVDALIGPLHETALHVACEQGFIRIVKLLLDSGANLKRCRSYGSGGDVYTALHVAAVGGSECTVRLLVQRGADVHSLANGRTPFHLACKFGRLEAASVLLNLGSDVNAVTENCFGYTALHYVAEYNRKELVKLLLSRNADVFAIDRYGRTPLHYAWYSGNFEIAEMLLKTAGAFTSAYSPAGASEVHYAVREDIVKLLLNCEADINARDSEGLTPLYWACFSRSPKIADILLINGADVNAELSGWTPLTHFLRKYSDCDEDQAIVKVFAKHVAKMQALNMFVNQNNLQALSDHLLYSKFFKAGKTEIGIMRKRLIGGSTVTFFDIFEKGPVRLADYMANESILNALDSGDFELQFPIYSENLRQQFDLGRERLDLLRRCDAVLNVSSLSCLPYVFMRKHKKCLTNDDLQSVLKSAPATQT